MENPQRSAEDQTRNGPSSAVAGDRLSSPRRRLNELLDGPPAQPHRPTPSRPWVLRDCFETPQPKHDKQTKNDMKDFFQNVGATATLGASITFVLITVELKDPQEVSQKHCFSSETVRVFLSVSWLLFMITLACSFWFSRLGIMTVYSMLCIYWYTLPSYCWG
ncbi:hypothetical protein ASPCAL09305 [Aspergillus calidoustus]|uniref:Uncharacterized protein n=1 Tax=Aspergillus calidoustus TaxID=454130 RepID=A0A0U5GW63_ASPCI|nr:hypothetical protein ASPCAL09305 [Aspergillus calidoustus]